MNKIFAMATLLLVSISSSHGMQQPMLCSGMPGPQTFILQELEKDDAISNHLLKTPGAKNYRDQNGNSLLHLAVIGINVVAVKQLAEAQPSLLKAPNTLGKLPLDVSENAEITAYLQNKSE